jgi:hypothetical protein
VLLGDWPAVDGVVVVEELDVDGVLVAEDCDELVDD